MSLPNIPDITPRIDLKRDEVVHLLLSSIAMEEISLSQIMTAEGEKMQRILEQEDVSVEDLIRMNRSVERMLRTMVGKQILLQFKLDQIVELDEKSRVHDEK
ncbi:MULTISPECIES: hypothetical protein [Brevibacillus]|uniref:Uncharacterized protein n=1 Tax=Brevibacillus invocatus TaxID=173959 RepID=A0A3M8C6A2_9BACL|nr:MULTISPECIES: hypothetical protein [Brevibacillus]MDH4616218.1 hypothetical protein [Brevibacillus sp. AY1]RNB71204.1 hypothetical protein EDM52_16105 [Brevibacillus invocatus]